MTTPTPPPWLSPNVLMRKTCPKWLDMVLTLKQKTPAKSQNVDPLFPMAAPSSAAVLQPFIDRGELAGAVTLVADRDGILDLDAIGFANLRKREPIRPDATFWIASQTKPCSGGFSIRSKCATPRSGPMTGRYSVWPSITVPSTAVWRKRASNSFIIH